jgi:hypothetical protein
MLAVAAPYPVRAGISTYDYLLTFRGGGTLETVQAALTRSAGTRLIGAF